MKTRHSFLSTLGILEKLRKLNDKTWLFFFAPTDKNKARKNSSVILSGSGFLEYLNLG